MNEVKVKYFLAIAETSNFTKAAEQLYISQSVLSRQIASIEKELGLTLFNRGNKNVSLTEAGKIFYDGLKDISWRFSAMLEKAAAVEKGYLGTIGIGALAGQMIRDFVPLLQSFEEQYPDIKVSLEAFGLTELRKRLLNQQLDFVFGVGMNYDYFPDLTHEPVTKVKVCIVLPLHHKHCNREAETLRFSDFQEDTFITLSESVSPILSRRFSESCKAAGITPKQIIANDLGTLMLLLETGRGISTLDETHVFSSNPHLRFIPLPEFKYFELSVVWNKENINPCAKTFIDHIKNYKTKFRY
jgi:DNA-binding transcriptional LysR family regulator